MECVMRTIRILQWRWGGLLLAAGLSGLTVSAFIWTRGVGYSVLGPLMILFMIFAAFGALLFGQAMHEVAIREILMRRSLRVRVAAEMVSRNRWGHWRIWAKCVSPVTCEEIWICSPLLSEDPKPYLEEGPEVLLDPKHGQRYYMLVEKLKKGTTSQ